MTKNKLLIVDDEQDLLTGIQRLAKSELDCTILTAPTADRALKILAREKCQLVLSDIRMPDMSGMELLETITTQHPATDVIMMTAYGTINQAVTALQEGAYDFVTKPLQYNQLFHTIHNCFERQQLIQKNHSLESKIKKQRFSKQFIGKSPAITKAISVIKLVADSLVTVLITGESGTGKELAAQAIHRRSNRSHKEMVAVNCAAIPESVLESELFGHKKGAFTGASRDHSGLFAAADGSTLFLDEIGDIPSSVQAKMLRVLQEHEIRPLGDTCSRKVDVRIIASTNRDLQACMKAGTFREDLYFRLSEITLHMPPLRSIRDDIPLMTQHFLKHYCTKLNYPQKILSPAALQTICKASWQGNVRQLQNVIKRAILLSEENTIKKENLDLNDGNRLCPETDMDTLATMEYRTAKNEILTKFSAAYLSRLLTRTQGNVSLAARQCGLERQSLQYLLKKYHISAEHFRS